MAKSNSRESASRQPSVVETIPTAAELIAVAKANAQAADIEPPKPVPVKSQFEMPPSYMSQMGSMMNLGNLCNSSPGGHADRMAATAVHAADELVSEFARQAHRIKLLEQKAKRVYPMPIGYMLRMAAMMVNANFYNASTGRNYPHMARQAFEFAYALCEKYLEAEEKRIAALGG